MGSNKFHVFLWIMATGVCYLGNDASFKFGVALTSPVIVNFGALFTVPISFIFDVFFHGSTPQFWAVLGQFPSSPFLLSALHCCVFMEGSIDWGFCDPLGN